MVVGISNNIYITIYRIFNSVEGFSLADVPSSRKLISGQ